MDAAGAALFVELLRGWTDADRQALGTLLDRFSPQLDDDATVDHQERNTDVRAHGTG